MIRDAEPADIDQVVGMLEAYTRDTPYHLALPDASTHSRLLFDAALTHGVLLVDEDATGIAGCIVVVIQPYMGAIFAEEVGWYHRKGGRHALALAIAAESKAVQKGATVLKMSAPVWTNLGRFYAGRGFTALETVFIKVLPFGSAGHRGVNRRHATRGSGGLPIEQEEEEGPG